MSTVALFTNCYSAMELKIETGILEFEFLKWNWK